MNSFLKFDHIFCFVVVIRYNAFVINTSNSSLTIHFVVVNSACVLFSVYTILFDFIPLSLC